MTLRVKLKGAGWPYATDGKVWGDDVGDMKVEAVEINGRRITLSDKPNLPMRFEVLSEEKKEG